MQREKCSWIIIESQPVFFLFLLFISECHIYQKYGNIKKFALKPEKTVNFDYIIIQEDDDNKVMTNISFIDDLTKKNKDNF